MERSSRSPWISAATVRRLRRFGAFLICLPLGLAPLACGPASQGDSLQTYVPRNAHQAYGYSLAQSRLTRTALGRDWLAAAELALQTPAAHELPLAAQTTIIAAAPRALGYRFTAPTGDRIAIDVRVEAAEHIELFVDLFEVTSDGLKHVASAPPSAPDKTAGREPEAFTVATYRIEWDVLDEADYVLRVQPELLRTGTLDISVRSEPLLAFPVSGLGLRAIQSGFGAERDGGRRAHRGVDIFAARGTEALAALDSWVSRVDTTAIGGNVVWLQPVFGSMRLYYAHLDSQLVREGQFVRAGDVIGTVGNTGNARTTPPHLHFGVYLRRRGMRGGARDPYYFLD